MLNLQGCVSHHPEPEGDTHATPQRNAVSLPAQAWRSFRRSLSSSLRSVHNATVATSSSSIPISSTSPADSNPAMVSSRPCRLLTSHVASHIEACTTVFNRHFSSPFSLPASLSASSSRHSPPRYFVRHANATPSRRKRQHAAERPSTQAESTIGPRYQSRSAS